MILRKDESGSLNNIRLIGDRVEKEKTDHCKNRPDIESRALLVGHGK